MTQLHDTTESIKGKHLTKAESSDKSAVRNRMEKHMIMRIMSMIQTTLRRVMKPTASTLAGGQNGADPIHLSTGQMHRCWTTTGRPMP